MVELMRWERPDLGRRNRFYTEVMLASTWSAEKVRQQGASIGHRQSRWLRAVDGSQITMDVGRGPIDLLLCAGRDDSHPV